MPPSKPTAWRRERKSSRERERCSGRQAGLEETPPCGPRPFPGRQEPVTIPLRMTGGSRQVLHADAGPRASLAIDAGRSAGTDGPNEIWHADAAQRSRIVPESRAARSGGTGGRCPPPLQHPHGHEPIVVAAVLKSAKPSAMGAFPVVVSLPVAVGG